MLDSRGRVLGIASGTSDGAGYFAHAEELYRFLVQSNLKWLTEKNQP
jgi:hypothetical protein